MSLSQHLSKYKIRYFVLGGSRNLRRAESQMLKCHKRLYSHLQKSHVHSIFHVYP